MKESDGMVTYNVWCRVNWSNSKAKPRKNQTDAKQKQNQKAKEEIQTIQTKSNNIWFENQNHEVLLFFLDAERPLTSNAGPTPVNYWKSEK